MQQYVHRVDTRALWTAFSRYSSLCGADRCNLLLEAAELPCTGPMGRLKLQTEFAINDRTVNVAGL